MTVKKKSAGSGAKVWFVGAGPGDPGLITVKGQELVNTADVLIYAGSLVNPILVERSRAAIKRHWGMHLNEMVDALEEYRRPGKRQCASTRVTLHSMARSLSRWRGLKSGVLTWRLCPVFHPSLPLRLRQNPANAPGCLESVIVTRTAGKTLKKDQIREFSLLGSTMVIFLGTEKLEEITGKLACPKDTPAAVVYHASWPDQKIVRGTVADIAAKAHKAGIEHTALLLVGGVVGTKKEGHVTSYLYS